MKEYLASDKEKVAISLIEDEKSNWEEGTSWLTNQVAYDMTNVVKKARKNYFGIYEKDTDTVTGRKKIFIPLTEWTVESVLKNIDIDTKDIEVKSKNPKGYKISKIFRFVLRYYLDQLHFGRILNEKLRNTAIDGTCYDKTWKENGELMHKNIDRLNMIVDPSEGELTEKSTLIERNLLTLPEFQSYKWDNVDFVKGTDTFDRVSVEGPPGVNTQTEVPYVEVYERYGFMPRYCLTGKEADMNDYVYGLIVVSGLGESSIVHKIKEVKTHPYNRYRFKDVLNRADGRGIPEMLFSLQAYLNEVLNTRLNTSRIAQLGLWHAKGNITPQQVKKLFASSVIKTDLSSEFNRLDTGSVDPSSYKDEDQIYMMSQRVTQSMNEDEMASNKPATNALIQERGSSKSYNLIMENIKLCLVELVEKKFVPIINDIIKGGEIIRITGDPTDLKELDEQLARNLVYTQMEEAKKQNGLYPIIDEEQMEMQVQALMEDLAVMGEDRYMEVDKDLFNTDFDIDIVIGDESMNKAVVAQNINNALAILGSMGVPAYLMKEPIKELFDTLGMDGERLVASIEEKQYLEAKQKEMEMQTASEIQKARGAEGNLGKTPNAVVSEAEQGALN